MRKFVILRSVAIGVCTGSAFTVGIDTFGTVSGTISMIASLVVLYALFTRDMS